MAAPQEVRLIVLLLAPAALSAPMEPALPPIRNARSTSGRPAAIVAKKSLTLVAPWKCIKWPGYWTTLSPMK